MFRTRQSECVAIAYPGDDVHRGDAGNGGRERPADQRTLTHSGFAASISSARVAMQVAAQVFCRYSRCMSRMFSDRVALFRPSLLEIEPSTRRTPVLLLMTPRL